MADCAALETILDRSREALAAGDLAAAIHEHVAADGLHCSEMAVGAHAHLAADRGDGAGPSLMAQLHVAADRLHVLRLHAQAAVEMARLLKALA